MSGDGNIQRSDGIETISAAVSPANPSREEDGSLEWKKTTKLLNSLFARTVRILLRFAFITIIYVGAAVFENLLFTGIWHLLSEEIEKYPVVLQAYDYARIGLALATIVGGVLHGLLSTIDQVKLDRKLSKEAEEEI